MKYQQETIEWVRKEIEPLLTDHYEEVSTMPAKLEPDWDVYYAAEQAGAFVVYTARTDEGRLVGYICFFIMRHPHYKKMVIAQNDLIFVAKEYRGKLAGVRLIDTAEQGLEGLGVQTVLMHVKPGSNDFSPMLHKRGYSLYETVHIKHLQQAA